MFSIFVKLKRSLCRVAPETRFLTGDYFTHSTYVTQNPLNTLDFTPNEM